MLDVKVYSVINKRRNPQTFEDYDTVVATFLNENEAVGMPDKNTLRVKPLVWKWDGMSQTHKAVGIVKFFLLPDDFSVFHLYVDGLYKESFYDIEFAVEEAEKLHKELIMDWIE